MKSATRRILVFLVLTAPLAALAEKWQNSYLSFELPQGWQCLLEGTEFVCSPPVPAGKPKPAIMILTAKIAGPDDNLAAYTAHLAMNPPATGKGTIVESAAQVTVNGTQWVRATLLGSEVSDFYTRYMATRKDKVAVLYTFSVHKSVYATYSGAMTEAVQTLQVHQPLSTK